MALRMPAVSRYRQPQRPNPAKQQVATGDSVKAPVGGWDAVSALADMPDDRAVVLDNWFPSTSDVRVRRGHALHCGSMGSSVVDSLMVYQGLTDATSKMFCATGSVIYDVSSSGAGASVITGLSNARWQWVNFTTAAAKFLWICNGADAPRHWNGSVWATPSLSITTYSATDIISVYAHKKRLWFVFKDSTVAGFLDTGLVAGTVTNFELGGSFTKGGYLVAVATWTLDGGVGPDDTVGFISSEGQVAVYAGIDPTDSDNWVIKGVYDIGSPIGRRCFVKVAGDLAIINIDGVLPMSKALQVDRGAAATIAITANINNAMNDAARLYAGNYGWQLMPYPKGPMVLLNVPIQEGVTQHQYVMNTLTGAWCRFIGMNANCWAVFNDNLYFGGNDGTVSLADTTGNDRAHKIDAVGQTAYNYFRSRGQLKSFKAMQPLLTTDSDSRPSVGLSTDFKSNASLGTPSAAATSTALYDSGYLYDSGALYGIGNRVSADWTVVLGEGQCASIHFRAQTGVEITGIWGSGLWGTATWTSPVSGDVVMRLNGFNVIFERGGMM